MRLYVDDLRSAPDGWVLARTVDEAVSVLRSGQVTEMSLDYDLGSPNQTGLHVLQWLEVEVHSGTIRLPCMQAHSGSIVGRRRLEHRIEALVQQFGI